MGEEFGEHGASAEQEEGLSKAEDFTGYGGRGPAPHEVASLTRRGPASCHPKIAGAEVLT